MTKISPDLLTFADGRLVQASAWEERRKELYSAIIPHEYGGMPPAGTETVGVLLCNSSIRALPGVTYQTYEVRTAFAEGGELSFHLNLWIPPGEGPFPVILDGDGCWRYFDDSTVENVLARGNIAAAFNRTAVAADNKDNYRDTGIYRLFPEAEFGVLSTWAWGYHRCIDVLSQLDAVRSD